MSACPHGSTCIFATSVEPSVVKRIRFSSAFPYCRGGRHETCELFRRMARGEAVPPGLLPDGATGDYLDGPQTRIGSSADQRFLVVDDSPVFATIAANAVSQRFPGADVVQCHSFEEAEPLLRGERFALIVSGSGLGGGRGVQDVRGVSSAPIVLFTGRAPDEADLPRNTCVVTKAAGPSALRTAIEGMLG